MTRAFRTAGLSLLALTAFTMTVLRTRDVRSQDDKPGEKPSPVEGVWRLVERRNGQARDYEKLQEGTEQIKYVTAGRFVWTVVRQGRVQGAAGGKYTVDKDKYTETTEYIHHEDNLPLLGNTFSFTWKVDGNSSLLVGLLKINGQDFKIDEKWERYK
jgi:hypothetical protein